MLPERQGKVGHVAAQSRDKLPQPNNGEGTHG
jgi:hypothetical protein